LCCFDPIIPYRKYLRNPQKTAACRGHPGQRKLQALSPPVSDFSCIRPDFAV